MRDRIYSQQSHSKLIRSLIKVNWERNPNLSAISSLDYLFASLVVLAMKSKSSSAVRGQEKLFLLTLLTPT